MSYGDLLPLRSFEDAMPRRIKEHKLAVGVVYTAMIDFQELPPPSIILEPVSAQQNAVIDRIAVQRRVFFHILDADLKPIGIDIDAAISDGVLDLSEFRIVFPDHYKNQAGENLPFELRTNKGFFLDYQNPVDISTLEQSVSASQPLSLSRG